MGLGYAIYLRPLLLPLMLGQKSAEQAKHGCEMGKARQNWNPGGWTHVCLSLPPVLTLKWSVGEADSPHHKDKDAPDSSSRRRCGFWCCLMPTGWEGRFSRMFWHYADLPIVNVAAISLLHFRSHLNLSWG